MIKAIFFDIDGTLVSFQTHRVPKSTRQAISELKAKGIKVFIATGRQRAAINNLGDLQFDGYVTINGGYCTVGDENKLIYSHTIPQSDVKAMIEFQKKKPFPCVVVGAETSYINFFNDDVDEVLAMLNFPRTQVRPMEESLKEDVLQYIAFFPENVEDKVLAELPNCESTRWFPLFTDLVPKGSNKAVGIDKIIDYFGIRLDETMAFGDGGNDIAMLKHAGISVAMGNAEDSVKEAADFVTDTVDADGIYKALKKYQILD